MEGLYIGKNRSDFIEMVEQNSGNLSLMAKGDGTEVMQMTIDRDKMFCVQPCTRAETMEYFYILEGSISYKKDERMILLKQGDYFYTHNLEKPIDFRTEEKTVLLYISTQPVFSQLSNDIKELHEIVMKVEKKDVYTHNHGKRVEKYSAEIAKRIGLPQERFEMLCYAALFHDIGKVFIPDEILIKPGPLTGEEYEIVKEHPGKGQKMVQGTFLEPAGRIIEQHHERLDGSGYPSGLENGDIMSEAKIIGVVDSYDAMISDRPYRKGRSSEAALKELQELKGKYYDPEIVDVFVRIIKNR